MPPPARGTDAISTSLLKNAEIVWDRDGLPFSRTYSDIYFSVNDPVAESRHVFIEGSKLPARMAATAGRPLLVGECGFGFGLNYLLTAELFCRQAPKGSRLHYISFELHPVRRKDLQRFFATLPSTLLPLSAALLSHYPEQGKGLHRLHFSYRNRFVTLDLVYGDALHSLAGLSIPAPGVDAWYLDGFTPTRNASLWEGDLFRELAVLSHAGTTIASYSVAGVVRRNLEAAGFRTEKSPGFGNKRHKLAGQFMHGYDDMPPGEDRWSNPWPARPATATTIGVIGAGLAGCATAYALAARGFAVTLVDKGDTLASGSSGNLRGLVHFTPARKLAPASRFRLQAFTHAVRHYAILSGKHEFGWRQSGVLQLAVTEAEKSLLRDVTVNGTYDSNLLRAVDAREATAIAGMTLEHGGVFMPAAGSIDPGALCRAWARHEGIRVHLNTEVLDFHPTGNQWQLLLADGKRPGDLAFDALVICHNSVPAGFGSLPRYPCLVNHGQVDTHVVDNPALLPAVPLCQRGYLVPWRHQGQALAMVGGSYAQGDHHSADAAALARKNLALLGQLAPGLKRQLAARMEAVASRAGSRLTTPDYQPLAGPVEDTAACRTIFAAYRRNARSKVNARPAYQAGLYVNLAHGSGGLTTTPLLAEYLASLISGEPLPLLADDIPAIHPLRFLLRDLKKQKG